MFYEPKNGHGLSHNPFNAVVSPRPIGRTSTRDADGHDNLASYSVFTPPRVRPAGHVLVGQREAQP
ncbi:hypothetical protein DIPPA_34351 [Diplonema papillatum]|nr:hypothetical protein DIPPA_34351 [Diplonema papillatum]